MRQIPFRQALREAMAEEMERDDRVFLMGEEVGAYQGAYKVSQGMLEKFGERRVLDTPIAETGFSDMLASGAVITGGTTLLDGMPEMGEKVLDLPVRRALPWFPYPMIAMMPSKSEMSASTSKKTGVVSFILSTSEVISCELSLYRIHLFKRASHVGY